LSGRRVARSWFPPFSASYPTPGELDKPRPGLFLRREPLPSASFPRQCGRFLSARFYRPDTTTGLPPTTLRGRSMSEQNTFADFIRRIRAGDEQAAAEMVRRYEPLI